MRLTHGKVKRNRARSVLCLGGVNVSGSKTSEYALDSTEVRGEKLGEEGVGDNRTVRTVVREGGKEYDIRGGTPLKKKNHKQKQTKKTQRNNKR